MTEQVQLEPYTGATCIECNAPLVRIGDGRWKSDCDHDARISPREITNVLFQGRRQ